MIILQKRIDSLSKAITIKDEEILKLRVINSILEAEKKQYVQMKRIQDQVVQKSLDKANTLNQEYLKEIQEIRDGNIS